MAERPRTSIELTSHRGAAGLPPVPIEWGEADPKLRGPIVATLTNRNKRNVIGTHIACRVHDECNGSDVFKDGRLGGLADHLLDTGVVEGRALTVTLLDELAERIREQLRQTEESLPLAKILEGRTWATGRKLAKQKRDGLPPIQIESDGTVF